jgi:hypothetical protein
MTTSDLFMVFGPVCVFALFLAVRFPFSWPLVIFVPKVVYTITRMG